MVFDFLAEAPKPVTPLARPRILSPTAGAKVSPLALGAMSIGTAWENEMGSLNKEDTFKLLDAFWERGGNFIDTANNYQNGESEKWIGDWAAARGLRDQLFIATKYTTNYRSFELGKGYRSAQFQGNGRKSLHVSLRASLANLKTDYIDLLYLHWWDFTTSIPEIMDALHALVTAGKVLYLGVSDTPAWIVAAANQYAIDHGKTPFAVYQGLWNVMLRDMEHDIVPLARHYGMALCPWGVAGQGKFKTRAEADARKKAGEKLRNMLAPGEQNEQEEKMSAALEKVAGEVGAESITAVAIAYVMQKTPYVFPLVGGRKVEHLDGNIEALTIHLSDEQVAYLEEQTEFKPQFPLDFVGSDPHYNEPGPINTAQLPHIDWQQGPIPIGHKK